MTQFYTATAIASSPVTLAEMKFYLKVTTVPEDAVIQALIDSCTDSAEIYTSRDFRVKTWELLIDCFADRIELRRSPVNTLTSVEYLVSGSFASAGVLNTDYYLKKGAQWSEVLLMNGKNWPTDGDAREQGVKITFDTKAVDKISIAKRSIMRCVAFMFRNRGDCCDAEQAIKQSGADTLLNQIRISRV